MAFKWQRLALAGSSDSLDDPVRKLEQGLDALSREAQEEVCDFYQFVNVQCPQLLPSVQEMIAQVLRDVRRHKAEQDRLLQMLTHIKHEHSEELRKMEEEVEQHIQRIKLEERMSLENQFKSQLKSKEEELEELRKSLTRLEETVSLASCAKNETDDTTVHLRNQVVTLQLENNAVRGEMGEIVGQLEQMRSEMGKLKLEYQQVTRELAKTKLIAADRARETEQTAHQIAVLELTNKRLRDSNDDLRSALETNQRSRRAATFSQANLAGDVDEIFLSMSRRTSSQTVDGTRHDISGIESLRRNGDQSHFLPLQQTTENHDLEQESDVEMNRFNSLYNLNNYRLLATTTQASSYKRSEPHRKTTVSGDFAGRSSSSGVYSATSRDRCVSDNESLASFHSNASQTTPTVAAARNHSLRGARISSSDSDENDKETADEDEREEEQEVEEGIRELDEEDYSPRKCQKYRRERKRAFSTPVAPVLQPSNDSERRPIRRSCVTKPDVNELFVGEPSRIFKVVLAGDSAVGKSSFLMRLCKNNFQIHSPSTVGVDFHTKVLQVDDQNIALQLWDTAGQERFRSIAKSYFRRADGVLLLFDVTYERSFLNVREWIAAVNETTDKPIPIMLVANKIDLRDSVNTTVFVAFNSRKVFVVPDAKDGTNVEKATIDLARLLRANEDMEVKNFGLTITNDNLAAKNAKNMKPGCCK